ncbi:MAG: TetR/AcrR family transcriptional regulator [Myxococcota bacterium]
MSEAAWVQAALAALAEGGVSAVRVEAIARKMGVTKGSFYHYFRRRRDLLDAALTAWEQLATEQIIATTDAASMSPRTRMTQLIQTIFHSNPTHDAVESAIREWAATDTSAQARVAAVDARRLRYVEGLLIALPLPPAVAQSRAALLYRALIGEYTWRRTGGVALDEDALDELSRLMLTRWR